ncbi:MAG: ABC transporter permease, partial [Chloroflexi bacterium]|nr:ABC transporter permease [Chloroflexota bacterium]
MTAVPALSVELETQSTRTFRHVLSVIVRDPLSLASTIVIILFILIAIFAYQVAPYPAEGAGKTNVANTMLAPSAGHILGADRLGRDMFSCVIMGARPALIVPIGVVVFAILIGAPLGAIAGYKGGWVDEVIMRITDLFLAFPSLLLAMAITSALGRGLQNAAIALIISWWPWYTRLVRGVTISLRERYFVEAARATGVRDSVIILRHILPNTISPILVQATVDLGTVIL